MLTGSKGMEKQLKFSRGDGALKLVIRVEYVEKVCI